MNFNHEFKKKFGQNFISDKNLLNAIVTDAEVSNTDSVLEIGAGAGTLTSAISERAKDVVSYEIDASLKEHLEGLNLQNVKFVFEDVMKVSLAQIESDFEGGYKMIANLPYYITTPIIFKFLNGSHKIESLTIMVQKEVAERIVAPSGNKDYGVLSVMIAFFGEAQITRIVKRNMFYPIPNVDSAIVNIKIDREKFLGINGEKFYSLVGGCFAMRRKTLKNNLIKLLGSTNEKINKIPESMLSLRPEMLSLDDFVKLFEIIYK